MIDFETMSNVEIAGLIESASAVLKRRLSASESIVGIVEKAQAEAAIKRPSKAEILHITDCLRIFKKSGFVRAADVHEYRRIADKFPEYMSIHRFPKDCRGSAITRWSEKRGA